MKKIILAVFLIIFNNSLSFAITLTDALNETFKNNTELNAERENINVSKEELNISKSNYLPSFSLSGTKSKENTNKLTNQSGSDASINDVDPLTTSIVIEQTIIDFSRSPELKKKEIGINLAEAKLLEKEQNILFKAIEAFTGLILANEKYRINIRNFNLLERQVETDRIRVDRGEITFSDLAQSESSFAGAEAKFIQAKNEIITSKLNYENIIGPISDPNSLSKKTNLQFSIPGSLNEAIEISKKNNLDILIAKLELEQSEKDIQIANSDLKPTATLSLERSYTEDLSTTYDEREKDVLKATVNWPFFSGGKNRAKLKKNINLKNNKKLLLENVNKTSETKVASAWSNLISSESLLTSFKSQVKAAEIANEGINVEYESGLGRSTLEVIQSNSLLLNAQISLADAERNYLLAQFNLLKSIGLLNSRHLKLR